MLKRTPERARTKHSVLVCRRSRALFEPVTQDLIHPILTPLTLIVVAGSDILQNLGQVYFFRRAGFLSAVLVRISFYLVWHVIWGLMY